MEENLNTAEGTSLLNTDTTTVEGTTEVTKVEETTKVEGAPEQYEFKLPDGMELDKEALEEFTPLAKELNLTQAQAQKLVELQAKYVDRYNKSNGETWANTMKDWAEQSRNDSEIGGAKFNENIGVAREAIKKFGNDDLRKAFDFTGIGNHPALIKFLYKVGKATSEDTVHKGGSPVQTGASLADRLYGN